MKKSKSRKVGSGAERLVCPKRGFWFCFFLFFSIFFFFHMERGRNFPLLENFKTPQSRSEGEGASHERFPNTRSPSSPSFTLLCFPAPGESEHCAWGSGVSASSTVGLRGGISHMVPHLSGCVWLHGGVWVQRETGLFWDLLQLLNH